LPKTCHYCLKEISLFERLSMKRIYGVGVSHSHCWNKFVLERLNTINTNIGLLMESNSMILAKSSELEKNQEAIAELANAGITENRASQKAIIDLSKDMIKKDEVKFLSLFDPFLVEYLHKVAGVELEELVEQVKNKETKRIINNILKEKRKNK